MLNNILLIIINFSFFITLTHPILHIFFHFYLNNILFILLCSTIIFFLITIIILNYFFKSIIEMMIYPLEENLALFMIIMVLLLNSFILLLHIILKVIIYLPEPIFIPMIASYALLFFNSYILYFHS